MFSPFGNVVSARIMVERETGRSRGFGCVHAGAAELSRRYSAHLRMRMHAEGSLLAQVAMERAPRQQRSLPPRLCEAGS